MKESLHRSTSDRVGKVLAVNSDPEIINILEANLAHADLEVISTRSGHKALDEVYKKKPDIIIIDSELPDIDGFELCQKLKDSEFTYHIPVILITDKAHGNKKIGELLNAVNYYITKPFDPKNIVDLVLSYLKQKERVENLSPLTGLPNETQVYAEINGLLERRKIFAAMYISMHDLRSFNRVYGYEQGDRTIRLLADIIVDAVRIFGNSDDLAGHLGGDKFVIISTPWKARPICRRIIADFNRRVKSLYTDRHLRRGYAVYESPLDVEEQSPVMSLHIAVITNQKRSFSHHLEVREAATEQMEYLKRFSGNRTFFDFQPSEQMSDMVSIDRMVSSTRREEVKAMYGVIPWLDYITDELYYPISGMKDSLDLLEQSQDNELNFVQQNSLKTIRDNIDKLKSTITGLTDFIKDEWITTSADLEEIDIVDTLNWIVKKLKSITDRYKIEIGVTGAEEASPILVDRKKMIQCLLYILRGEIRSSVPGSKLHLQVIDEPDDIVKIQLTNSIQATAQDNSVEKKREVQEYTQNNESANRFYPAKLLAEALGGELHVVSTKTGETTCTMVIPKKWQSITQESRALQLAVDVSRSEARAEITSIDNQLASVMEKVPQSIENNFEKLHGKVQELGVLCNRSLFLADEYRVRLETQQERLLHHEQEQIACLEAIVIICRQIADSMGMSNVFDLQSARNVAKYALAIAGEIKLSDSDSQMLYQAALLKDLGITLSPSDMIRSMVVKDRDEAKSVERFFNIIWQALSLVTSFSQTLNVIFYRFEKYRGDNQPLGSRILSVADTFESMISGRPPYEKLSSNQAIQKVVDGSGLHFDPYVVRTLLLLWKNNKLDKPAEKSHEISLLRDPIDFQKPES
jgi:response regulator RpfG family c-di-GMP phosphodiesterase